MQYRTDHAGILDPKAIERLKELDPAGTNRLVERVLGAFRASLERTMPKIRGDSHGADADAVRLVAHTLKSSAASVGALRLSQLCGDLESALRHGAPIDSLALQLDEVAREVQRVLDVLPPAESTAR
jgi:HPt (histidine-containing phosphotransfer) domain-containing protein